jgi:hypothetical protein
MTVDELLEGLPGMPPEKRRELRACEAKITRALGELGQALKQIRDGDLYRDSCETFGTYAHERWPLGRKMAEKLIARIEAEQSASAMPERRKECGDDGRQAD